MQFNVTQQIKLLDFLSKCFPDSSKSTIRSWLKEERILVEGTIIKEGSYLVFPGNVVEFASKKRLVSGKIQIHFQDEHLMVVEKPEGLLSVATDSEKEETLIRLLSEQFPKKRFFPVHRLDRNTSGLMIVALSEVACHRLNEMFKEHLVQRIYVALLEGTPSPSCGEWESYLVEDANFFVHSKNHCEQGVYAKTFYRVLKNSSKYSLVEFKLATGRKNQIRVHAQAAGCPILGDKKYGSRHASKRLCLHAYRLIFEHPISQKTLQFQSPIPESFLAHI